MYPDVATPAPHGRGRRVAICGFAKPHRDLAPYNDPEWEVWGVNDAWSWMPRADRWFEVHSPWIYEWELRRAPGHLDWLRQFGERGGIAYTLDARADMPRAVPFPFAEVVNNLWPERAVVGDTPTSRPYLTSSIAYMQALAIAEGFEEIGIWGVDMAADSEYAQQKPACEYLLGLAKGRGIRITLPEGCGLLKGPLYGRGAINPGGERISTEQLGDRMKDLDRKEVEISRACDQLLGTCQQIRGAMTSTRELLGEAARTAPEMVTALKTRLTGLEEQLNVAQKHFAQAAEQLNLVKGAKVECQYWIGLTPYGGDARLLPPVLQAPTPAVDPTWMCNGCSTHHGFGGQHHGARPAETVGVTA